jgi:hypothetical protein
MVDGDRAELAGVRLDLRARAAEGRSELALEVLAGGVDELDQVDGDGPELAGAEHRCPVHQRPTRPLHLAAATSSRSRSG